MSHELELRADGTAVMAYAGAVPWHGLGVQATEEQEQDPEAFLQAAGLTGWDLQLRTVFADTGKGLEPVSLDRLTVCPENFAVVRAGTDSRVLGVVGADFRPLQNETMAEFFAPFCKAGQMRMHAAGSLRGGRRVWALAKFPENAADVVPGDEVRAYLMLSHGHDGSLCLNLGFTATRVVCANTERMARESGGSHLIKLRHTKGLEVSLEQARQIMDCARRTFEVSLEQWRFLASRNFDGASLRRYVRDVFEVADVPEDEVSKVTRKQIETVEGLALAGKGQDSPRVRGTYWAAYNGVSEFVSHGYQGKKEPEDRAFSLNWGRAGAINERALELATKYAAGLAPRS